MNRAKNKIKNRTRQSLLYDQKNKSEGENIPTFSTAFSADFGHIKNIFYKYLPILNRDEKLRELLGDGCRCVAKRGKSLGNILSPSDFATNIQPKTWLLPPGFFPCGGRTCALCQYANKTKEFPCTHTNQTFKIK